jgi:hypothetical protein
VQAYSRSPQSAPARFAPRWLSSVAEGHIPRLDATDELSAALPQADKADDADRDRARSELSDADRVGPVRGVRLVKGRRKSQTPHAHSYQICSKQGLLVQLQQF